MPFQQTRSHGWEQHVNSAAAYMSANQSRSTDAPPPPTADANPHIQVAAAPNPHLQARLSPPRHPDHQRHRPRPGPAGTACLVDADWELARALAADPFHLDWPHW